MQQLSVPKGTRDFLPSEMAKRNYIFNTIRQVYELYGFVPIETPAMENLSTLLGKYGDEGDKLLFRILNSGNYLSDIRPEELNPHNAYGLSGRICEKGLRYDLTVPFARFVVMHKNDLSFPFRRYQIQPVWRADRPQKGRYREFYQCDADIIGSDSLLNEFELLQIIDEVFSRLNLRVIIKINHRKILTGMAEMAGCAAMINDLTTAIDKLDKTSLQQVKEELATKGFPADAIATLESFLAIKGTPAEVLQSLTHLFSSSETGQQGIRELSTLFTYLNTMPLQSRAELDITLARGLNYYTGTILEVKSAEVQIGSIGGGGRYDNLTGIFGLPGVSGVGISFGADRIYDVLTQLGKFPAFVEEKIKVMFVNFGPAEEKAILPLAMGLRQRNIPCLIYPDQAKIKKQMAYASGLQIPYVAIIGEEELKNHLVTLKKMDTGEQTQMSQEQFLQMNF